MSNEQRLKEMIIKCFKIKILLIGMLLSVLPCLGQGKAIDRKTFEQMFETMSKEYRAENYQVVFDNSVFMNPGDTKPYYSAKGKYIRGKGKQYRTESGGQITLQTDKIKMVIDSARKLVLLFNPDTLYNPVDLSRKEKDLLWGKADFNVVQSGSIHKYMVRFNLQGYEYKSAEYWIDVRTNKLQRMVMQMSPGNYYSEEMDDQTSESPLIVLNYSQLPGKVSGKDFMTEVFLKEEKGGYSLLPVLDGFVLDDLRIRN